MSIPYERIIQWAAGPVSALAGGAATYIASHTSIFAQMGFGKDQTAKAIYYSVMFIVTTVVTFAAHHKWLTNLPQWWDKGSPDYIEIPPDDAVDQEIHAALGGGDSAALSEPLDTAVKPDPEPDQPAEPEPGAKK